MGYNNIGHTLTVKDPVGYQQGLNPDWIRIWSRPHIRQVLDPLDHILSVLLRIHRTMDFLAILVKEADDKWLVPELVVLHRNPQVPSWGVIQLVLSVSCWLSLCLCCYPTSPSQTTEESMVMLEQVESYCVWLFVYSYVYTYLFKDTLNAYIY